MGEMGGLSWAAPGNVKELRVSEVKEGRVSGTEKEFTSRVKGISRDRPHPPTKLVVRVRVKEVYRGGSPVA